LYFDNSQAKKLFNSEFYFDVGFILEKTHETEILNESNDFELIDFKNFIGFSTYLPTKFYPNDLKKIELPKNSQGFKTLEKKYKIIWNKERTYKFYYTDRNILPNMSSQQIITSDNQQEMFYLFALLNSKINEHIFKKLFMVENEKSGLYIVVRRLKEFIKTPIINEKNVHIKNQIIKLVEELINSEQLKLADLVDFSNVMFQKIDNITFSNDFITLFNENNSVKCKIIEKPDLIQRTIKDISFVHKIEIQKIKNLFCIDKILQNDIVEKINNLVFILYFNIEIVDIENINAKLESNKYYEYIKKNG